MQISYNIRITIFADYFTFHVSLFHISRSIRNKIRWHEVQNEKIPRRGIRYAETFVPFLHVFRLLKKERRYEPERQDFHQLGYLPG